MLSRLLNIILLLMIVGYAGYYIYKMPKLGSGENALDFNATLLNGEEFRLSSLQGNYVLLDFWGSWCGPCRMENPALVKLFDQYGQLTTPDEERFYIVNIGIERDKDRWRNAIKRDKLHWKYHICEEGRFTSPIAKLYGVREIPTKYLLDTDGSVIFTNPDPAEIDRFLAEKFETRPALN